MLTGHGRVHPRLKPRDGKYSPSITRLVHQRQPESVAGPPTKARRHDADDGVKLVVQAQLSANGAGIAAKKMLPQPVTDNRDRFRLSTGRQITGSKSPTEDGQVFDKLERID